MNAASEIERRSLALIRHIEDMLTIASIARSDGQASVELERYRDSAKARLESILTAVDRLIP